MDLLPQTREALIAAAAELHRLRGETQAWLEQNALLVPEPVKRAVRGEVNRLRRLAEATALAANLADDEIPDFEWP